MSDRQKDQQFIDNLRATNLKAVECGGCAPPVYITAAPPAHVHQGAAPVLAEAREIAAHHPSKDARAFAESVIAMLATRPAAGDKVRELVEKWRPHGRVPVCELEAALAQPQEVE